LCEYTASEKAARAGFYLCRGVMLKALRGERGLSNEELGRLIGVDAGQAYRLMRRLSGALPIYSHKEDGEEVKWCVTDFEWLMDGK